MADIVDINIAKRDRENSETSKKFRIVDDDGVEWFVFLVDYEHDGKQMTYRIWATSWEDAENRLASIAKRSTVVGRLLEEVDA